MNREEEHLQAFGQQPLDEKVKKRKEEEEGRIGRRHQRRRESKRGRHETLRDTLPLVSFLSFLSFHVVCNVIEVRLNV